MKTTIQIKIKMDNGKEVTLNDKEAKELYLKLKEFYGDNQPIIIKEKEYIPQIVPSPWDWKPYSPNYPIITFDSSINNVELSYKTSSFN